MLYFLSLFKSYKIKLFIIILVILCLNFFLIPPKYLTHNIAQNLRIYSCQPNFTEVYDGTQFKLKRLYYGLINFFKNGCDYETINIDIKFKNLEIIKDDRSKALSRGILLGAQKVPANIIYRGEKFKSKIRLKGDLPNHWSVNKQWSLKVELKNKKSINGMKEFSITKLAERNYPDNLLIANQFKRLDLISSNFKIYNVKINGEYWGLMLAEEQFSNVFLENRKLKDGLIFKLTNQKDFFLKKFLNADQSVTKKILISKQGIIEIDIFNKRKINNVRHFQEHETIIKSINSILNSNFNEIEKYNIIKKYFDIKKIARLLANSIFFQSFHTLRFDNVRFYLNPYNLKIEPIPSDNLHENTIKLHNKKDYNQILNKYLDKSIYNYLLKDEVFLKEYQKSLVQIKSDIPLIKKDLIFLCNKFEQYCENIINFEELNRRILLLTDMGPNIFLSNKPGSKKIKSTIIENNKISSNVNEHNALKIANTFIYSRLFKDYIKIYNLSLDNLKLLKLNLYYENKNDKRCHSFIKKNCNNQVQLLDVNLDKSLNMMLHKKIKLSSYNNKNLKWGQLIVDVKGEKFEYNLRVENQKFDEYNLMKSDELDMKYLDKLVGDTFIISGKLYIDTPIIVPKNFNLKIVAGSEIFFGKKSYIYLNQGNLLFDGKNKQIKLLPKKDYWGGIYVNNSPIKSKIINTTIKSTKAFQHEGIFLSGGVNFYRSDIEILNSKILDSKSEDALNIINSSFQLVNLEIKNSLSDGLDSDFSNGLIKDSFFNTIGGDAIDTSGSEVTIQNVKIYEVDDKGLSAGENSKIMIENLLIDSSRFAIVSKDLSIISGNKIHISNSKDYDIMAFQKKMHYGPGFINISDVKSKNKTIVQKNSEIKIDNKKLITQNFDPSIYY